MDIRSRLYRLADPNPEIMMGDHPGLPALSGKPTLLEFFKHRFDPPDHLLQSARLAKLDGHDDKIIFSCLLHDIGVIGFLRGDHGYWGEQMVAPYVDEEVSWAIRAHQVLRFFPDESVGYTYPEAYLRYFGTSYQPDEYIRHEYERIRNHRWYMTARLITVYDVYSFDPNVHVELDEFADLIGAHFRQPSEGLGFDNSPAAHIWRTIRRPDKFL